MRISWDKKSIDAACSVIKKHVQLDDALHEISRNMGRNVTVPSLASVLSRHGKPTVGEMLKLPDLHPIDARERREHRDRQSEQIESLTHELRLTRERQKFLDAAHSAKAPPKVIKKHANSRVREMTAVVLASDWHVEEEVTGESVAFRNEYSLEIADKRIDKFFRGICWNIEHHRASGKLALENLVLWLGGDLISGYIHPELAETNALSPTEAVRWLLPRLRNGIATLAAMDLSLTVPCSFGNHGRTTDKPRVSSGYANSYEWLMYHVLSDEFRGNPKVTFEITNSPHQYVDVYDKTMHFTHGDEVKYMGGVGGLGIPLLKAVPMWDRVKPADVHCLGHHHTVRDFGRAVVNGSLIGYGPYSQRIRAEFEPPGQLMFYMDSERGKSMPTTIWVDDSKHGVCTSRET